MCLCWVCICIYICKIRYSVLAATGGSRLAIGTEYIRHDMTFAFDDKGRCLAEKFNQSQPGMTIFPSHIQRQDIGKQMIELTILTPSWALITFKETLLSATNPRRHITAKSDRMIAANFERTNISFWTNSLLLGGSYRSGVELTLHLCTLVPPSSYLAIPVQSSTPLTS